MLLRAAEQPLLQGANIQVNRRLIALLSRMLTAIFDGADPTPSAASAAAAFPAAATDDDGSGGEALGRGQRRKRAKVLEPAASPATPSQEEGGGAQGCADPPYQFLLPIRHNGGRPGCQCYYCKHGAHLRRQKGKCKRDSSTTRCDK